MSEKDSLVFMEHILESIRDIENFLNGISKDKFLINKEKQNAVIKSLEIIGEAVKNLPVGFTIKYPYVDWARIAGMKNKLVHQYFGVDLEIVWKVLKDDLPQLKKDIKEILEKEKEKK